MIRDKNIQWARQRLYIPVGHMSLTGGGVSMENTVPALAEVSASALAGMDMTANDIVAHHMEFPSFWDITKEIGVAVWWTAKDAAIATDAATFIILFDQVDEDELIIIPATALSTAITALDLYGTTNNQALKKTARGVINADTFDESALDGFFAFSIELDAVTTFSADEVILLGVSFDYYPRLTVGGVNNNVQARQ